MIKLGVLERKTGFFMKKLIFLFLTIFISELFPQYKLDTLSNRFVGPGVKHLKISVPSAPWTIDVLEADLSNPFIKIETVKAKDKLAGNEKTSSMAARNNYEGHYVVGGVNGDFYNTANGVPINIQIDNGEILRTPIPLTVIGFNDSNKPMMSITNSSGSATAAGMTNSIAGYNSVRGENQLILYNSYMGLNTGTNQWGTEILVSPVNGWIVNDTVLCVVEQVTANAGSMPLSAGKAVLSGHGSSAAFLNAYVKAGDTIKVFQKVLPALSRIKEMIGGFPKIVAQGKNYADQGYREEGGPSHAYERNPRTAAGFSADSTKLFLITVDGRQNTSVGMTLPELGDLMVQLGVAYGVNFDGGGSTTMLVRGKIENIPSDGSERAVSNSLLVISTAPKGTLQNISVSPGVIKLYKGEKTTFTVTGFDEYYNPALINNALLQFSCDPVGTISSTGEFQAGENPDTGYVYVTYGDLKDSALVIVKGITRITLFPKNIMTDSIRTVNFKVNAYDMDSAPHTIAYTDFIWKTSDESIGLIDSTGLFKGSKEGTVLIIADYNGITDTSEITVEIGKGTKTVDPFDDPGSFSISGQNMEMSSTKISASSAYKTSGSSSIMLDYKYTGQAGKLNYVYLDLKTPVRLYGVPEYLYLDVKSDSLKHRVYYVVEDDNGEEFRVNANKYAERAFTFDTIPCPLKSFAPISTKANFYFPISVKRIELQIAGNKTNGVVNTGVLYLDNFRAAYPLDEETGVESISSVPADFTLFQNYPNPFNPVTVISFSIPEEISGERVQLKIFDILGRETAVLIDENMKAGIHKVQWNAAALPSGIYMCRIESGKFTSARKMVLLK